MGKIERALISVSDKTGLEALARALVKQKIEIISSGGTATFLKDKKIPVIEVSDFTNAPEMLDGRVKTLHPKIHAGILAKRNSAHLKQLKEHDFSTIDLVIVNLYPFEQTLAKTDDHETLIENIDVGGPTMLRSAAKNHASVTVLTDPKQYEAFVEELTENNGDTSLKFRKKCAQIVFEKTASYDAAIATYFQSRSEDFPKSFVYGLEEKMSLRYGENPHQRAVFALPGTALDKSIVDRVLQGKQISFNNLVDVHAAIDLMLDLDTRKDHSERKAGTDHKIVAILKHTNPCGVGIAGNNLEDAYVSALACDPISAFGGIVICSHEVDEKTANLASEIFTEIMIAPKFSNKAIAVLEKKKNLRLIEIDLDEARAKTRGHEIRKALDGYLIQEKDNAVEDLTKAKVVTKRKPTKEEVAAMDLAWKVCKHVKSNAIVLANQHQTVGIGAGQMSRVDSCKIAIMKMVVKKAKTLALASDAFFPFRDSIDEVQRSGVTCIVQPGGSIRDAEVIEAADEHDIAMIFTNVRHFKH